MKFFSRLLIIGGIVCLIVGGCLFWERNDPNRLRFKDFVGNYKNVRIVNPPIRVVIRGVSIDLPIYPSRVSDGVWATTTLGASYLTDSPIPGDIGNSIIYGHNWQSLFGNLVKIQPGDSVEIVYKDGSKRVFTVIYTSLVSSDALSILAASRDKRITLYTCSGWFDEKRFVAVAVLNNEKAPRFN